LDFTVSIDNEHFVDLDVEADILEKASAISKNEEYDTRIQLELTLDDTEMFTLMTMAHERDLTLNQMVEHILTEMINKEKLNEQ
jgi:predicted HicB family RNase H-like nuclease